MPIVRLTKFRTNDGKEFASEDEAKQHELLIEKAVELKRLLDSSLTTFRIDAIVNHILLEHENVRVILNSYQKRLPRKRLVKS